MTRAERPPYPETKQPFVWPTPGQRTWVVPERSYFGPCTGREDCDVGAGCPVGVVRTVGGGPYGCDCCCHQ